MMFLSAIKRKNSHLRKMQGVGSDYDVIIHIGPAKTGSSAIQHMLLTNRERLSDLGYYYPKHDIEKNHVSGGHSELYRAIKSGNVALARKLITKYKRHAAKAGATLILSSEAFPYYHNIFEQLQDVLDIGKTAIIAFYRDPIERLLSLYNQAVKRHFKTNSLSANCYDIIDGKDGEYSGVLFERWAAIFQHEHVYIYPYQAYSKEHERLEYAFLKNIGIPSEEHAGFVCTEAPVNSGYSPSALELKRLLNSVLRQDEKKINTEIDASLQRYSDQSDEQWPNLCEMIDTSLYNSLCEKFNATNKFIKKNYLRGEAAEFLSSPTSSKCIDKSFLREYSIRYAVKQVFGGNSSLSQHIKNLIQDKLNTGTTDYNTLQLAEAFGFNISSYTAPGSNIESGQIRRVISEDAQLPDCLRELSLILERSGKYDEAFQVIQRALTLRPGGPLIVKIHERLKNQKS